MPKWIFSLLLIIIDSGLLLTAQSRARDYSISIGVLPTGQHNAITDVAGVQVGHRTVIRDSTIRTGVTVIIPHMGNIFQEKVPAAVFVGNGFGKLAGSTQIEELGNIETPIVLTNTLSVGDMVTAMVKHILSLPGNEDVHSVNAVVGETNDGYLNDIRRPSLTDEHLIDALENASNGPVTEGNVGAGTGTICFGWKGGIGTSSRVLPENLAGYTIGVLVQTNFGASLRVDGAPVGEELRQYYLMDQLRTGDGSCMIVVATDAPILDRNLKRLAERALYGLARTGGIGSNGSGDYVLAFTTHPELRINYGAEKTGPVELLTNDGMSPLFAAVIEATEEAIINSLFTAETMVGYKGRQVEALPVDEVMPILKKYGVID